MKLNAKHFGAALATLYGIWLITSYEFHLMDNVNLLIHEGGHVLFSIFGQTSHFLGGTLMQLIVPLIFLGYFFMNSQHFSASIMGLWFGGSLINVSVYMADTHVQKLHLLGGGMHDWLWLFGKWHLLNEAETIATVTEYIAYGIIILSLFFAWRSAFKEKSSMSPQI